VDCLWQIIPGAVTAVRTPNKVEPSESNDFARLDFRSEHHGSIQRGFAAKVGGVIDSVGTGSGSDGSRAT